MPGRVAPGSSARSRSASARAAGDMSSQASAATRRCPCAPHASAGTGASDAATAEAARTTGKNRLREQMAMPRRIARHGPLAICLDGLEADHPGRAVDHRVQLRGAELHAVDLHVALDVDPARIHPDRAALTDREVDADVPGHAPGAVELELAALQDSRRLLLEELREVDAGAQERPDLPRAEVVLQRHHRRQVLRGTDLAHAL